MGEAEIIARVERERQSARVEALLVTLRALAVHGDNVHKPIDTIGMEDARLHFDRQEAWHAGHEAGIETGQWLAGNEAQDALDEWERTA